MLFSANRKSKLIMIFAFLLSFVLAFVCSPKIKNKDGSLHFLNLLFLCYDCCELARRRACTLYSYKVEFNVIINKLEAVCFIL